jgi:hypothetical protein
MVIYKKYVAKARTFLNKQNDAYVRFLSELKKLYEEGKRTVTLETIHFYIRRHSYLLARTSRMKERWDEKARRYYFKFWIRRAEIAGFLKRHDSVWEITEKIMDLNNIFGR